MREQYQLFVNAKLQGMSDTAAAVAAGYKETSAYNQGHRLMRNDEILAAIAAGQQEVAEAARVDAQWVLEELKGTYLEARQLKQLGPAKGCLELIGKHFAMFTDKVIMTSVAEEAARIAAEQGLDPADVLAETERLLAGKS